MVKLRNFLASRAMPWVAVALALILSLRTLSFGPMLDDLVMRYIVLKAGPYPGGPRGNWDLYRFADGESGVQEAIELGLYPWWTSHDLKLAFFRPLSSYWVAFDQAVFTESPWAWHLGSLLLYGALVLVVAKLYGRFIGGAAAGLATLLYAIDDARVLPIVWAANRHSVLSAVFGFAALYAHSKKRTALGVGLFAAALAAGESAMGVLGYFLAYAWFSDERRRRAGVLALVPYGVLTTVWIGLYLGLGYGAGGSDGYIHPTHSPLAFLSAVLQRGPQLVLAQLLGPPSEVWIMLPPSARVPATVVVACVAAGLTVLLLRAARAHRSTWFFALGALGSIPPLCATFAADRMLLFPGFGAFGLMAIAIGRVYRARIEGRRSRVATVVVALALVVHLVLAPLMFVARVDQAERIFIGSINRGAESLPAENVDKPAIVMVAPDPLLTSYMFLRRFISDRRLVPGSRVLCVAQVGTLHIERTGDSTLTVRTSGPAMYTDAFSSVFRDQPFQVGAPEHVGGLTATVLELDPSGYPTAVRFDFDGPIGPEHQRWIYWQDDRFHPFDVPAVGASVDVQLTDWATAYDR